MKSKNWYFDEEFLTDAADAWEEANEVDDNFIKSVTGKEPDYNGEIRIEKPGYMAVLPFGFEKESGVFSSILNKFIDPSTGNPIEE